MFFNCIFFPLEWLDSTTEEPTTEATTAMYETTVEPTSLAEPVDLMEDLDELDNTPLEPLAQTSVQFDTQVQHTVQALISWHRQIQAGCDSSAQPPRNYTITYHTVQEPEEIQVRSTPAPFILLTDLLPNQDYVYEVTSSDINGNILWSAKDHLSTG